MTLRGDWNPHFPDRTFMVDSYIRPAYPDPASGTGFDGDALIVIDPAPVEDAYYKSAHRGGPRLYGLALRGCYDDQNLKAKNKAGSAIHGILVDPGVKDVGMDKVTVWRFTGDGLNARNAAAFQLNQVHCVGNDGHGFTWGDAQGTGGGLVDADLFQCYSQGNGGHGYDILNPNAVTMVDCRAEWNDEHGYHITGINYSMVMVGCNTDRNAQDGFHLSTSAGGRFLQLLGCLAKRDGREATDSAGFRVTGTAAEGVVLTACSTSTGRDDDNTGSYSPSYGITTSALNSASCVSVVGGEYVGTAGAFHDEGAVVVRHSGVVSGTHTGSGIVWDKFDVHRLSGAAGTVRDVEFWSRGANVRWALRATAAAESGSNQGSDFALVRYADNGAVLDTPITVSRASGRVTLTTPGMTVNATASPGVNLVQTQAAGQGYAVTGADTASRGFQSQVTGDSVNRFAIGVDGTQSFGPGGSTGRDTSWGRLGAARIGSGDSDIVAGMAGKGLRVKEGTNAKMGTLTLNGATAVQVATTAVTATSRIFLTVQAPGGTPAGVAYVSGRTAGSPSASRESPVTPRPWRGSSWTRRSTLDMRGRVRLVGALAGAAALAPLGVWAWPDQEDDPRAVPTDLRDRDPGATPEARRVYALLAGLENDARRGRATRTVHRPARGAAQRAVQQGVRRLPGHQAARLLLPQGPGHHREAPRFRRAGPGPRLRPARLGGGRGPLLQPRLAELPRRLGVHRGRRGSRGRRVGGPAAARRRLLPPFRHAQGVRDRPGRLPARQRGRAGGPGRLLLPPAVSGQPGEGLRPDAAPQLPRREGRRLVRPGGHRGHLRTPGPPARPGLSRRPPRLPRRPGRAGPAAPVPRDEHGTRARLLVGGPAPGGLPTGCGG